MKREELINARKDKKMSQGMLARMVGVSNSAISHYERNVSNPSIEIAFKIANFLGEGVEKLWGEEYKIKKVVDNSDICGKIKKDMGSKEKLRECRKKAKLTQKELAKKAGLSMNMISLIELGLRAPGIKIAKKLCKALGVTLNDIWGNGEKNEKEKTT